MELAHSEIVVTYRGVERLVEAGLEAVSKAPSPTTDPLQDAVMVAGIEAGLTLLKNIENDPRARGGAPVFTSVDHKPASLLQSFMAEQAAAGRGQSILWKAADTK